MRNATEDRALLGRVWNKMPVFPAKTQETGVTKSKHDSFSKIPGIAAGGGGASWLQSKFSRNVQNVRKIRFQRTTPGWMMAFA